MNVDATFAYGHKLSEVYGRPVLNKVHQGSQNAKKTYFFVEKYKQRWTHWLLFDSFSNNLLRFVGVLFFPRPLKTVFEKVAAPTVLQLTV